MNKYIVEKLVDGYWWPEGSGTMEYVNRIIPYLVHRGLVFRIIEVG